MKGPRGLTYAGQAWNVSRNNRPRQNRYQIRRPDPVRSSREPVSGRRLHLSSRRAASRPGLGKPARLLVAGMLGVISLAAMTRGSGFTGKIAGAMGNWWSELAPRSAPHLSPPAPIRPQPAVGREADAEARAAFKPVALISDEKLFYMDAGGLLAPCPAYAAAEQYPIVTGVSVREVPGKMGIVLEATLNMEVIRSLLQTPFVQQLSEIHFGADSEIVLYTREAAKIKLENGPHLGRDLRRLNAVLEDLRTKNMTAAWIDMRYQRQAIVRPRGGNSGRTPPAPSFTKRGKLQNLRTSPSL